MKTAISIPDEVFSAAEQAARRMDVSRSELYTRAIREYLADISEENVTAGLNVVYGAESSKLDARLGRRQAKSVGGDAW